jgi:ribosomal protein S3AE
MKGKEWYVLLAPKLFKEKEIGETPVADAKTLINRQIEVYLMNLIDDFSKYYMKFFFKVKEIEDDKAKTEFSGLECLRDYISRMIRYGIARVDTVQDLITSDKVKLRVKSIIITNKKIRKNVEINLKNLIEDMIKKTVESNKLDDFIKKVISDDLKNSVLNEGSKIYPIRNFEIRKVEMLS